MEDPKLEFISLDEIPDNSFIMIKVDVAGPMEKYHAADYLVGELNKHSNVFYKKKLTIMILTSKESIDVLNENEMNQAGWYRKSTETFADSRKNVPGV